MQLIFLKGEGLWKQSLAAYNPAMLCAKWNIIKLLFNDIFFLIGEGVVFYMLPGDIIKLS